MPTRPKQLPRNPRRSQLVHRARLAHRRYQARGLLWSKRIEDQHSRDAAVWQLDVAVRDVGEALLNALGPFPTATDYRAARSEMRSAYDDQDLLRDLRNVRYNPGGPLSVGDLFTATERATVSFREAIAGTKSLGRKPKRLARARAWRDLHATLSALDLAFLAFDHQSNAPLKRVASGSLR